MISGAGCKPVGPRVDRYNQEGVPIPIFNVFQPNYIPGFKCVEVLMFSNGSVFAKYAV